MIILITAILTSLMYLGFGLVLLFNPVELLKGCGIYLSDPVGIMEVRSFYGGLEIGLGAFIMLSYYIFEPKYAVMLGSFLLFFTLVGRFYGLVVDSAWSNYFIYAVAVEGSIFLLNAYSFYSLRS